MPSNFLRHLYLRLRGPDSARMKDIVAAQILVGLLMLASAASGNDNAMDLHEGGEMAVLAKAAAPPPTFAPSSAPAPAPSFVNLTELLDLAGPYKNFLSLLEGTQQLTVLQAQANNTQVGVTIFVPSDTAFSSLRKYSLSNLTDKEKKALVLYHAIPKYYSLSDFQNLSNPVNTFATGSDGGQYDLNVTANGGYVSVSTGLVHAPITSSVFSTDPVALYAVGKILLPEEIFGLPSPSPAPSPAPVAAPISSISPSAAPKGSRASKSSAEAPGSKDASAASFLGASQSLPLLLAVAAGLIVW